ncbi:hypothetical protein, partial [Staphylococcus hominis]|uniref:hypothetical protein n=1 Tax=Staphylococcus hominis TaxID=1290 RepID=UPI001C92C043
LPQNITKNIQTIQQFHQFIQTHPLLLIHLIPNHSSLSHPLFPQIQKPIPKEHLLLTSLLSGNPNFEGPIHPLLKPNYLPSPQLLVPYPLPRTV